MAVHNEADILQQNIDWYYERGFQTVVVDNCSTDGSYEICQKALAEGKISVLDTVETNDYAWDVILDKLVSTVKSVNPDWLMLTAPDEFFETASGDDLKQSMLDDIKSGYNIMKFFNMEFWMTEADDMNVINSLKRIQHYSCFDVDMYRAYPLLDGLDLKTYSGHKPAFKNPFYANPSKRIYISRHYKLRNIQQAAYKVKRIRPTQKSPNTNVHYLNFSGNQSEFLVPSSQLHHYKEDHVWYFDCVYDGRRGFKPK